jgi:hypothetical protein
MANVGSTRNTQTIRFLIDSDATGGFSYTVPTQAEILQVRWTRTDAAGGGFVTLTNNALVSCTIGAPASQYDSAVAANYQNVSIAAGKILNLTASLNTIRGRLYITILPGI